MLWKGGVDKDGYGKFAVTHRITVRAPRFAYQLEHGRISRKEFVLHRCDTPGCCEVSHLWVGTLADNNRDRAAKGRSCKGDDHWSRKYPELRKATAARGDDNGSRTHPERLARGADHVRAGAKLDEKGVREVVRLRLQGLTQRQIASWLGVTQPTVQAILSGKAWSHITGIERAKVM